MNSHEVFIHIHQGCFAGTGAIVRLPQCQWSKPVGYGKISQCITTTKHSKAKTVCIFLGTYCTNLLRSQGCIQQCWFNRCRFETYLWQKLSYTYILNTNAVVRLLTKIGVFSTQLNLWCAMVRMLREQYYGKDNRLISFRIKTDFNILCHSKSDDKYLSDLFWEITYN